MYKFFTIFFSQTTFIVINLYLVSLYATQVDINIYGELLLYTAIVSLISSMLSDVFVKYQSFKLASKAEIGINKIKVLVVASTCIAFLYNLLLLSAIPSTVHVILFVCTGFYTKLVSDLVFNRNLVDFKSFKLIVSQCWEPVTRLIVLTFLLSLGVHNEYLIFIPMSVVGLISLFLLILSLRKRKVTVSESARLTSIPVLDRRFALMIAFTSGTVALNMLVDRSFLSFLGESILVQYSIHNQLFFFASSMAVAMYIRKNYINTHDGKMVLTFIKRSLLLTVFLAGALYLALSIQFLSEIIVSAFFTQVKLIPWLACSLCVIGCSNWLVQHLLLNYSLQSKIRREYILRLVFAIVVKVSVLFIAFYGFEQSNFFSSFIYGMVILSNVLFTVVCGTILVKKRDENIYI